MSRPDRPTWDDPASEPGQDRSRDERAAAEARIKHQGTWVDLQIRQAVERGDFDDLPGYGKPLEGLTGDPDPDWWVRRLVEREGIVVLPPALQLRKDDAELDARLDRLGLESEVRREVEDFNERVRDAKWQPLGGPPLITRPRDVEAEVARWRERRDVRRATEADQAATARRTDPGRRRWWQRRRR